MFTLFNYLSSRAKLQCAFTSIYIFVYGFVELLGIFSIIPYLSILSNPSIVNTNKYLSFIYENIKFYFNINLEEYLLIIGTFSFFLISEVDTKLAASFLDIF